MVAGHESASVVVAVDEGVDGVAAGGDSGLPYASLLTLDSLGLEDAGGAALYGGVEGVINVGYAQGDIFHAVAVLEDVLGDGALGEHGGCEHKADLLLLKDVGSAIAHLGLGAGVGGYAEAHHGAVEVSGLPGVAHVEFYIVDTLNGKG